MFTLLLLVVSMKPSEIQPLPQAWQGTWRGTLKINNGTGSVNDVPFSLEIKPLPDPARVTWHITYGEGEKRSVRPYELVALPGKPGEFELDEKSGIRMKERLLGNELYCLFRVNQSLLHVKHQLKDDVIRYEICTYQEKDLLKSEHGKNAQLTVDSYRLVGVQTAELTRAKP